MIFLPIESTSSSLTQLCLDQQSLESLPDQLTNNSTFPQLTTLSLAKAKMPPSSVGRLSELVKGPSGLTELCLSGLKLSETDALTQLLSPGKLIFAVVQIGTVLQLSLVYHCLYCGFQPDDYGARDISSGLGLVENVCYIQIKLYSVGY